MRFRHFIFTILCFGTPLYLCAAKDISQLGIVPAPQKIVFKPGIVNACQIEFKKDTALPKEGYRISISKKGIAVFSSTESGRFYAEKTLEQLKQGEQYPCCEIVDEPKFPYRGFMIDEARHFFGKEAVKKIIDEMSRLKFNYFHWHLCDDQGWRIELKEFPELTEYGSWRMTSPVFGEMWQREYDGKKYGPFFYTEDDAREIVKYAAERHITIIPELDVPGHCQGMLAGYPWMLCEGQKLVPRCSRSNWWLAGIRTLCIGNDKAIEQTKRIMDAMMRIFPGEYFHFGGDECPCHYWEKCSMCQARMKAEGLSHPSALQGWFTREMTKYLVSKGRKPIGWHEILGAGNIPKETIVMSWRGLEPGVYAAKRGNNVIMTPSSLCYFSGWDGDIGNEQFSNSKGIPGGIPKSLDLVYSFNPLDKMPKEFANNVLGGQCCVWTEFVFSPAHLEWRLFPRAAAIAEILWTYPDSKTRDYKEFRKRVTVLRKAMKKRGVNVATITDMPVIEKIEEGKIKVFHRGDEGILELPKNVKKNQVIAIVRTMNGGMAAKILDEIDIDDKYLSPILPDGEELLGCVYGEKILPAKAKRMFLMRHLWNAPLINGYAPKTAKKLTKGENVVVACAGKAQKWHEKVKTILEKEYKNATVSIVSVGNSLEDVVNAKADIFIGDVNEDEEKTLAALRSSGIEWMRILSDGDSIEKRRFSAKNKIGIADTLKYLNQVEALGIPLEIFKDNPSRFFANAIEEQVCR